MSWHPAERRYAGMVYDRCGRSGLKLPAIALGLWHNFGGGSAVEDARAMIRRAFDLGITHFDLANNYGPPPGSAEETVGRVLATDLRGHRDELVVSTKAGYDMWPGPYGDGGSRKYLLASDLRKHRDELVVSTKAGYDMWPGPYGDGGSRKYLLASLDQSLRRMDLDYVDVFYSHRPDPETPLEETMGALDRAVRSGKALYAGISSYPAEPTAQAASILRALGTPCVVHQPSYSIINRWVEGGLLELLEREGIGCIVFSPLAQGLLSDRYLAGIPPDSRVARGGALRREFLSEDTLARVRGLDAIARRRGQSLAQMALAWVLKDDRVTSAVVGASRPAQIEDSVHALERREFSAAELAEIDRLAFDAGVDLWTRARRA